MNIKLTCELKIEGDKNDIIDFIEAKLKLRGGMKHGNPLSYRKLGDFVERGTGSYELIEN